jgi:hypothetical protein
VERTRRFRHALVQCAEPSLTDSAKKASDSPSIGLLQQEYRAGLQRPSGASRLAQAAGVSTVASVPCDINPQVERVCTQNESSESC